MTTVPFSIPDLMVGFDTGEKDGRRENNPALSNLLNLLSFLLFLPTTPGKIIIYNYGLPDGLNVLSQMFPHLTFLVVDPNVQSSQTIGNLVFIKAALNEITTVYPLKLDDPLIAVVIFPFEGVPCESQPDLTRWYFSAVGVFVNSLNFLLPLPAFTGCSITEWSAPPGYVFRRPFSTSDIGMLWVTTDKTPKVWDLAWYRNSMKVGNKTYLLPEARDFSYPGLSSDYNSLILLWCLASYLKKTSTTVTPVLLSQFLTFIIDTTFKRSLADLRK